MHEFRIGRHGLGFGIGRGAEDAGVFTDGLTYDRHVCSWANDGALVRRSPLWRPILRF